MNPGTHWLFSLLSEDAPFWLVLDEEEEEEEEDDDVDAIDGIVLNSTPSYEMQHHRSVES